LVWEKPAKNLEDALDKINDSCRTLQLEHRLDPYSAGEQSFLRGDGDKIVNPHLGDGGVKKICEALKENTSVKALDLSGNRVGAEGVEAICDLLKENETIEVLYLEDNRIDDEDCEELAHRLKKNKTLKQLSLSGNQITSKGAKAIAHALKKNDTLEALWLNRNKIRDGGAKEFGRIIRGKNDTLDMLCFEDNKIRERGAKGLAKGLRKAKGMRTLNLGGNKIGAKGAKYFEKAIKKNEKNGGQLDKLILDGNRLNGEDMEILEAKASAKKVKLQGRTRFDVYGDEMERRRKGKPLERARNYLKYHTKPSYFTQGHFDPEDKIKKQL